MDEHRLRIFNAIATFVCDLNTGFGKKYKPVALYNRLIEKTTINDTPAAKRHIEAFEIFFTNNTNYIQNKTLADNARIIYSDRIYLDIGKIVSKLEPETHKHIHQHLVTIYSLLNLGTQCGREALETLKQQESTSEFNINFPDTNEGNFIKGALTDMTDQFNNLGDDANPMAMMAGMMQSGFFTKFMTDLQTKFNSGEMNLKSLMGTVTNVITTSIPQDTADTAQITNLVSQVTAMTGGQELPLEGQERITDMLNTLTATQPEIPEDNESKDSSS